MIEAGGNFTVNYGLTREQDAGQSLGKFLTKTGTMAAVNCFKQNVGKAKGIKDVSAEILKQLA